MADSIRELKIQAEILHKRIKANDIRYLRRLRILAGRRRPSDEQLARMAATIRRRDCLSVIAAELGFPNWPQAKAALTGDSDAVEFGTLLYPVCGAGFNRWYARYEEAVSVREACHGYLLAYKRQYLVVDRYYIESLGLDPDDTDWDALGFDWVRPASLASRTRLYIKLVAGLRKKEMKKKEAIEEYKARKALRGVFAVRCTATGQVWVDSSPNLDAARNSVWFFLRHGYHHNKTIQAEWNTHGEQAFQFEILEKLDDDLSPIAVSDLLKERRRHWAEQLGAQKISV